MSSYKVKVDHFRYILDKEEKVCWCYDVSDRRKIISKLKIPRSIKFEGETYRVIGIEDYGFYSTKVKNIILPDTIETIGEHCFSESRYLEKIVIPSSVKIIGENSFYLCCELQTIEFLGDPVNIDIENYCFLGTKYIDILEKKLYENKEACGYIGRNLVALAYPYDYEDLYIKPGTKKIYLEKRTVPINNVYIPKGVEFIDFSIKSGSGCGVSLHFETYEDFLKIENFYSYLSFSKVFIGGKDIKSFDLPKGIFSLNIENLSLFSHVISEINLNTDIKQLNGCTAKADFRIRRLYLPSELEFISYGCFYNVYVKEFSSKLSTLLKFNYQISELTCDTIVLYIDVEKIVSGIFNRLEGLLKKCVKNLFIVPIINYSPEDLYKILYELQPFNDRNLFLDPDFLKIDKYLPASYFKSIIYVNKAYFNLFKIHKYWSDCKYLRTMTDLKEYEVDIINKTCNYSVNLDKEVDYERNIGFGIVKIHKKVVIDGDCYRITGIGDFAFTDCPYLEEVIVDNELEISNTAFFGSDDVKITRINIT